MRLVYAWILIAGFNLPWWWYLLAALIWLVGVSRQLITLIRNAMSDSMQL